MQYRKGKNIAQIQKERENADSIHRKYKTIAINIKTDSKLYLDIQKAIEIRGNISYSEYLRVALEFMTEFDIMHNAGK